MSKAVGLSFPILECEISLIFIGFIPPANAFHMSHPSPEIWGESTTIIPVSCAQQMQ